MKFSELLGEPEPESEHPETDAEPISVFAPVPVSPPPEPAPAPDQAAPPVPAGGRSGLAELNVRPPIPEAPTEDSSLLDQLTGLDVIVDDLLPSRRGRR